MNGPTNTFFLAFRGKEVALVRGGEENPDEWGFPIGLLGNNPTPEEIERILKEKGFLEITVETVGEIQSSELGDVDSMFIDTPIYVCDISGKAKVGPVFFANSKNTEGFNLSEKARVVLFSQYVQGRLV